MKNNFNNLDNDFIALRKNDKLNIFSIKDILNELPHCKQ